MRESLIIFAKYNATAQFEIIIQLGYELDKFDKSDENCFAISYKNENVGKKINISICDNEELSIFFIGISIIRQPYSQVNDFIDFDTFLKKNSIKPLHPLEGEQINEIEIENYIREYVKLFNKYGIILIESNKKFSGYNPEWT